MSPNECPLCHGTLSARRDGDTSWFVRCSGCRRELRFTDEQVIALRQLRDRDIEEALRGVQAL